MTNRNRVRLSQLSLGLAIALAAAPAFAQQTSAGLGGFVTSEQGQPVAGAEVIIVHTPSGTTARATTDASGRYSARGLRVGGPYAVTVVRDGFQNEVQENVYLALGESASVDMALAAAQVAELEAVQVFGTAMSSVFGSDRMGSGTNVSREDIDRLPSIARNIQDYMRLDPRIAQTDKERTEISAGGQNTRFNNIRIDGVTINDGFGLGGNNLTTARQPISIDAIEALNISLANYDVGLSGYTGANVDAVTKSGTNEFSGSVYGLFRDGDWARNDLIPGSFFAPPQQEQTYGMTFGGPLIRDKLFFFLGYEKFDRTLGAPTRLPAGITAAQIQEVRDIARTRWGFDAGDFALPGELNFEVEDLVAKIDWNINDDHRAYFRYNKSTQVQPFLRNIGARSLSLSSHWHTSNITYDSAVVQLFSDWSDTFSTEFKIGRSETSSRWDQNSRLPQVQICLNASSCSGADSIYIGSEQFRQINVLETQIDTAYGAGFLFLGDHEIKFGAEYQNNQALNLFGRDQFGVYQFVGLDAFRNGTPSRFNVRYPVNGDINSIAAQIELENMALFVQDTWSVNYNLTLNYGLRYDVPRVPNPPPANRVASGIFGYDNSNTIDGNGLLQPRFGFNYTFDTERPTQLRGGVGLFSGAAANVWLANPYQNNGGITLGEFFSGTGTGIVFSPNPDSQPGTRVDPNNPTPGGPLDLVDGELGQPAVWKANLAFDHELPLWDAVFSAELLLTSVEEGLYYENLNLGRPSLQARDGRVMYWGTPFAAPTGAFVDGPANARGNRNRQFTDVTVLRPTNKGESQQLTVSLSRPMTDGWSWSAAYTYTNATEVSPLTSSQSMSNWGNSFRLNPNVPVSARSVYEVRDRFVGTLGFETFLFDGYKTSFALFYEGRSGRPYSWSFINDANGDGRANDLLYVPSGPGDVIFTGGAAMERAFFDYMARNPGLARFAGSAATPGSERSPWVNSFDIRVSQELPGFFKGHKSTIWLDLVNVGNLINKDWGRIEEVGFPFGQGVVRFAGIDRATGRYRYNFSEANVRDMTLRDSIGESRWSAQIGFRYSF